MGTYELLVNGKRVRVEAEATATLLSVLREKLDLTGAKCGCGEGQCGSCAVLVDGRAVKSCLVRVASVAGKRVTTIEGLAGGEKLHPVQQAFLDAAAFQCGFCTPGMIMAAVAMLGENARPEEEEIRKRLEGNICRCGSYPRIVAAVRMASGVRGRA